MLSVAEIVGTVVSRYDKWILWIHYIDYTASATFRKVRTVNCVAAWMTLWYHVTHVT